MKNLFQRGNVIDYANGGAAIVAGAIVGLKHCIGVARTAIAATTGVGAVDVEGVFYLPKVPGTAWLQGEKLIYDVSAGKMDASSATPATGDITGCGVAAYAAASGDAFGYVKLTPGNCTLT